MDFRTDWKNEMINRIKSEGIKFSQSEQIDSYIIRYITYLRKKGITLTQRNIYKSKEFYLPIEHIDLQSNLNELIVTIKRGADLSDYISKDVKK